MALNARPDVLLCGGRGSHCSDFALSKECILVAGEACVPAGSYSIGRPVARPRAVPLALGEPKRESALQLPVGF